MFGELNDALLTTLWLITNLVVWVTVGEQYSYTEAQGPRCIEHRPCSCWKRKAIDIKLRTHSAGIVLENFEKWFLPLPQLSSPKAASYLKKPLRCRLREKIRCWWKFPMSPRTLLMVSLAFKRASVMIKVESVSPVTRHQCLRRWRCPGLWFCRYCREDGG